MTYNEAAIAHKLQWGGGKHKNRPNDCVFPYNHLYAYDSFIIVDIPIDHCKRQQTSEALVDKYAKLINDGTELGPSWILFGKILKDGSVTPFWHNKCYVVDGNHRMEARNNLNHRVTKVIIPQSNYDTYMRIFND